MAARGLEPRRDFTGISRFAGQGDSQSDSLSDARLAKLIAAWPTLEDDVKDEIFSLVTAAGCSQT